MITKFLRRLRTASQFHLERVGILNTSYPRRILQNAIDPSGILFEVHNLTEANRVAYFDGEEEFLADLIHRLEDDDVFFDIGGCIGLFALHSARHCQHVFVFEPEPGFRQHLEQNISINKFTNVTVLPYAISEHTSVLTLFTNGTDGKSPSLDNNDFQARVSVDARSLSDLTLRGVLPNPTVIKMDIEGAEILALRGMRELLHTKPPRLIFLELHPVQLPHFGSSLSEVLSLLEQVGYSVIKESERDKQFHYIFEAAGVS